MEINQEWEETVYKMGEYQNNKTHVWLGKHTPPNGENGTSS